MIEVTDIDEVRILRLSHGRASALDIELVETLRDAIGKAVADGADAIVLTGTGHIFCAGVDLFRVAHGGETYVRAYIPAFKQLMFALFTVERPLIVAANGHALAGGAVLVAAGDYRMMARGEGRFGYTELLVGVPFPPEALEIIRFATPPERLPAMLYSGATFPPDESLAMGLIDEVAAPGEFMGRALEVARQFARVAPAAFAETKRHLRAPALDAMRRYAQEYGGKVLDAWTSRETHARIRAYLDSRVRKG
jgi:enoyl-CoA hydratase